MSKAQFIPDGSVMYFGADENGVPGWQFTSDPVKIAELKEQEREARLLEQERLEKYKAELAGKSTDDLVELALTILEDNDETELANELRKRITGTTPNPQPHI